MEDLKVKNNVLGFGRAQLKYTLFHNTSFSALTEYSHKRGLFFFNTDTISVDVIKDNGTDWVSFLTQLSPNNPYYDNTDVLTNKLLIGGTDYSNIKGFNQGVNGFLKVNNLGVPSVQPKMLFTDIDATAYTTSISSPGVHTRFATEKAIVDYLGDSGIIPSSYWERNGSILSPITANNVIDFESNGTSIRAKGLLHGIYGESLGNVNGYGVYGTSDDGIGGSFQSIEGIGLNASSINGIALNAASTNNIGVLAQGSVYDIQTLTANKVSIKSAGRISGQEAVALDEYVTLNQLNNSLLYIPTPITIVSNILNWDTNAYKPYTSKTVNTLYSGTVIPNSIDNYLNYDGIFRSSRLYEGNLRVMTSHGSQPSNGNLHTVATTTEEGFLPKLPLLHATSTFLRGDGTWQEISTPDESITVQDGMWDLRLSPTKVLSIVPYNVRTVSSFYTGATIPTAQGLILNYDGRFRSTELYEGNTRVMTEHGPQPEDGTFHKVATVSHAGFCPKLPPIFGENEYTYLSGLGTWRAIPDGLTLIEDIAFDYADITPGTSQTYTLKLSATYAFVINSVFFELDDGTLTGVSIKINGTSVDNLDDISISTVLAETTAAVGSNVAIGDRIELVTSVNYTGNPSLLRGQLNINRG